MLVFTLSLSEDLQLKVKALDKWRELNERQGKRRMKAPV